MSKYTTIIQIDDCLISSEILTEYYACDYAKCKGCCCVIGDSGAPLEESEIDDLERNYPKYSPIMSSIGREIVDKEGYFVIDSDGDAVTPLVPHSEECVYTRIDDSGFIYCAIEKAWHEGKGDFKKPISCWLYPIRISVLSNGMRALNLHRWDICKDAFRRGKKEKIRVFEFLHDPIVHHFGEEFYDMLAAAAKSL